jgi:phospholipid transport system substrate-binding protein
MLRAMASRQSKRAEYGGRPAPNSPLRRCVLVLLLLSAFAGASSSRGWAAPPGCDSACAAIASIREMAVAARASGAAAVRSRMRAMFDVETMAQGVLAQVWSKASVADRREFTDVMFDQIARGLIRRIGPNPEALEYLGDRKIGENDVLAMSRLTVGPSVVNLDWRMRRREAGFRVLDVLINGRSIMASRREDYAARLAANGNSVQALTTSLRDDLARAPN